MTVVSSIEGQRSSGPSVVPAVLRYYRDFCPGAGEQGIATFLLTATALPLTGTIAEAALERAGITCNKNGILFDPEKPTVTSGVRLGSSAVTTRGFGVAEFEQVGDWIAEVLDGVAQNGGDGNRDVENAFAD
jgi:glycine/serine hydroxymethyltransferase